jgi:hypothetical protein
LNEIRQTSFVLPTVIGKAIATEHRAMFPSLAEAYNGGSPCSTHAREESLAPDSGPFSLDFTRAVIAASMPAYVLKRAKEPL